MKNPLYIGELPDDLEQEMDVAGAMAVENEDLQNVYPSQLCSTQKKVCREIVDKYIMGNSFLDEPITAVKYNGKLYVIDGNHRAVAARERKWKRIKAFVGEI